MEGDIKVRLFILLEQQISTHALTWRATCCDVGLSSKSLDFYPRPHMEGDESKLKGLADEAGFLPTPSHGGRQQTC